MGAPMARREWIREWAVGSAAVAAVLTSLLSQDAGAGVRSKGRAPRQPSSAAPPLSIGGVACTTQQDVDGVTGGRRNHWDAALYAEIVKKLLPTSYVYETPDQFQSEVDLRLNL